MKKGNCSAFIMSTSKWTSNIDQQKMKRGEMTSNIWLWGFQRFRVLITGSLLPLEPVCSSATHFLSPSLYLTEVLPGKSQPITHMLKGTLAAVGERGDERSFSSPLQASLTFKASRYQSNTQFWPESVLDFFPIKHSSSWFHWLVPPSAWLISEKAASSSKVSQSRVRMKKLAGWLRRVTCLTCKERRSGRCAGAPGSQVCASPGGSRREQWCGGGVRRTPGPGTSRTAAGSLTPMRPAQRTDAGPETHGSSRVNHQFYISSLNEIMRVCAKGGSWILFILLSS